ncbi:MAG: helicase [Planctomycetes bacterium]|nr:helicase [Planctomycetota bacterium]
MAADVVPPPPVGAAPPTSEEVRGGLVEALRLDLVGPDHRHAFAAELLPDPPSRWYLTGFLVPRAAPEEQKADATVTEEIDAAGDAGAGDDVAPPDRAAARRSYLPSSMGLSVLAPAGTPALTVTVEWGDYAWESADDASEPVEIEHQAPPAPACASDPAASPRPAPFAPAPASEPPGESEPLRRGYRRRPCAATLTLPLPAPGAKAPPVPVPASRGLNLVATVRCIPDLLGASRLPAGTLAVSMFLVNDRAPDPVRGYRAFAFQATLTLALPAVPSGHAPAPGFVARPDLRGATAGGLADEADERVADLQYRDVFEFAVGHGVSAYAVVEPDGACRTVRTTWIPTADVERVTPAALPRVELGMEALGDIPDAAAARAALLPLVEQYRAWIVAQEAKLAREPLDASRRRTAADLLTEARHAAGRIAAGIDALADPLVFESFVRANRAMAQAGRQRARGAPANPALPVKPPEWYPFQLAFLLMNLCGVADPSCADRENVDLLFFPTGGGKTEAYLGLAAFAMVLRRLRHPGKTGCGVSVLMRYTLRLLTLDQLGRAAALVCALELARADAPARLGEWPFEIGLWVGSAATPNRMGWRGYDGPGADDTAYVKTSHYKRNPRSNPAPIPLENCPWCGEKFTPDSFRLSHPHRPLDLHLHCVNPECPWSGDRPLPIVGVDEPLYRRLPAFVIATVDKFAALPWTGETGGLFGLVDRHDEQGFYGPCAPERGRPLGGPLPPPDLIIQDELHLISGPLGTIAGVYETAIDALAGRSCGERVVRPKIIASTATVRRAEAQIRALFGRERVTIFPCPGPDRRDAFFARTVPASSTPARRYVGVAAPGRSLKVVLLRTARALLSAGQAAYDRAGGRRNPGNPADPYLTLVGYFNSLRELGGTRRIVEDEVRVSLEKYARRRRRAPSDALFVDRTIGVDVLELTSRVPTHEVAAARRRLGLPFADPERVDIALATNMISVGLDILRLGLMVVLGQPKTSAEYIQATSRVGRDPRKPGLVVTLLNVHKPRDRSHYERFAGYHAGFYRAVEATSVTPFAPRALDRALAAALAALCRHGEAGLTPSLGASGILTLRQSLDAWAERFAERAEGHRVWEDPAAGVALRVHVRERCKQLLDSWWKIAQRFASVNARLKYQRYEPGEGRQLLYEPLHRDLPTLTPEQQRFRAGRSMRDVEPEVELTVKKLNDWGSRA